MAANQGTIKLGPWGGPGGSAWDFNSGSDVAIKEIVINHGDVVDSVTFTLIDRATGEILFTAIFGGTGGQPDQISIDWPGEYLTLISGTIIVYLETLVVESLTFHTNRTTYGPYGQTNGSTFEIPMENGEIVGFFGSAGAFVDAIVGPIPVPGISIEKEKEGLKDPSGWLSSWAGADCCNWVGVGCSSSNQSGHVIRLGSQNHG